MRKTYKQGIFNPINKEKYIGKNKPVYRSSWELKACLFFDKNPNVKKWSSESIVIPYVNPVDKKLHRYFVDFVVQILEGDKLVKYLIEVKPFKETLPPVPNKNKKQTTVIYENFTYIKNQSKWSAASQWAKKHGMKFLVITEKELKI